MNDTNITGFYFEKIEGKEEYRITSYCGRQSSVTIPATYNNRPITEIRDYAFFSCYSLTDITIGNNVTSIGSSAFARCANLKTVTIENSVKTIDDYAFRGCVSLISVTIPSSVRTGTDVFLGCVNRRIKFVK